MEAGDPLFAHLRKLPIPPPSDEALSEVLQALWRTRRTGLDPPEKSRLRSLLALSASDHLDPVLSCLRSVIRKSVIETLSEEDIIKLLPYDLPTELTDNLMRLLQKYHSQWKEQSCRDQPLLQLASTSQQIRVSALSVRTIPKTTTELSSAVWPREVDAACCFKRNNAIGPILSYLDLPLSCATNNTRHPITGFLNSKEVLPCLDSMTWTLQNKNSTSNLLAVIILKLQDHSKTPPGEIEVKFQLSKDTVEAMLRSVTRISEQLSNSESAPLEPPLRPPPPTTKKQRR